MKLYPISTGTFKLDGGAMFGVVPKTLWNRHNPADENNLCTWAMRCLLIENGNRLMLVDTGLGSKQTEKFFSFYQPNREDTLENSLKQHGFHPSDVTDVLLTHLHFDHCGGAVNLEKDGTHSIAFPQAQYWVSKGQWETSHQPNPREKASFLTENFDPIQASGQLNLIENASTLNFEGVDFLTVNGHTEQMILPLIEMNGRKVIYLADLMPSIDHINPAWVMAYDVRPLDTMKERQSLIEKAIQEDWILFFEHDAKNEAAILSTNENGKTVSTATTLSEVFG
jgi:glyoxylase-like metal-dependent hydrolase (beta-lactamase superfamily II)